MEPEGFSQEVIKEKTKYFRDSQEMVHIVLKDTSWLNGTIKSIQTLNFTIVEKKKGLMPVFFKEVFKIEKYDES